MRELSVKVHTGYFSVVCCFFPFLRAHTFVSSCAPGQEGGLSSRQESEEARGRPHATSRRGREEMEKREEVKNPKTFSGKRRRERQRAEEEEEQEGVPGRATGEKV